MTSDMDAPAHRNLLLRSLGSHLEVLAQDLEPLPLTLKTVLHEENEPISHVYFVTSGVVSMVNEPNDGEIVEIATVGREGVVGISAVLGVESMATRSIVQIAGEGFRLPVARFRRAMNESPDFHDVLMRYTMALMTQIAQSASCNRVHEVQERYARWLMHTLDRIDGDTIPLTQEFLSQMLGVHRPTVSIAAAMLQKAGLIDYTRGVIRVLNRAGLESAACPCYARIAGTYNRLLPQKPPP
jgi:CRP-like cAMP-binding protein